jgi:hypothetical protein
VIRAITTILERGDQVGAIGSDVIEEEESGMEEEGWNGIDSIRFDLI